MVFLGASGDVHVPGFWNICCLPLDGIEALIVLLFLRFQQIMGQKYGKIVRSPPSMFRCLMILQEYQGLLDKL